MSDLRCPGVLYVSGSTVESEDWGYRVYAECNGMPDCGFFEQLSEFDDDPAWGIDSDEMTALQERHLAHSRH